MKVFLFIVVFLFVGGFFIISNENLALNNSENINLFASKYFGWLDGLFENTQTVAGYVVKMEWLPNEGKIE